MSLFRRKRADDAVDANHRSPESSSDVLACWRCGYSHELPQRTCAWCGVWLVDLHAEAFPDAIPLIELARRWGIPDDGYRADALSDASEVELDELCAVDAELLSRACSWLADLADVSPPSELYVALTCLVMASDHAEIERRRRRT